MELRVQSVVVHKAETEILARLRAIPYEPRVAQAAAVPGKSWRFVIEPRQRFHAKGWKSERVAPDVTIVRGVPLL
jgi:hypothetical protein